MASLTNSKPFPAIFGGETADGESRVITPLGTQTAQASILARIATRLPLGLGFSGILFAAAALARGELLAMGLLTGGCLVLVLCGLAALRGRVSLPLTPDVGVDAYVGHDASPCFVTDIEGEITYRNAAAGKRFEDHPADTLSFAFRDLFANPSAVIHRLRGLANRSGGAREDVVTRRGHVRLSVQKLSQDNYLWRLDDMGDRVGTRSDVMSLPMLTASNSGTVLFMNEAFRKLTGGRVKSLDRIFRDLPLESGCSHTVDTVEGPLECIVAEIEGKSGRKEVYLLPGSSVGSGGRNDWADIEHLPVPLMKVDAKGEIRAINRDARKLLHSAESEASINGARLKMTDLLRGLGRPMSDWLKETIEGSGRPASEFLRARNGVGDTFVQVSLSPIREDGEIVLIAVMSDVTEFKTLEAQFVQSQKMQAIGQLAGGVAHDFNNLLTAISGHCDLLLLRHDQGDPDYGDLVQINQNANRAASLVGQLLAFSRKQNLRPEMLDLRDTLSDLTHLLNRLVGEKVTLTLTHDPSLRTIRADKRQLEQVLMNLVVNARDAMVDGGEITVETEDRTLTFALERDRAVVPAGDYSVVKVSDVGSGITQEALPKIFEPFYTTKRTGEGTGLGLSTAYGIVKQTGGFIFADSVVGEGTTFILYFPVMETPMTAGEGDGADDGAAPVSQPRPVSGKSLPPAAEPSPDAATPRQSGDGVVLLVEDEAPVRAFASRALRLRGYTVLEAESAEAALAVLADKDVTVDIFVTDVVMPGMDGPSWVREALIDRPDTKVVFVSGYAEDAFADEETAIPNSVFLPKPFSLSDLTATVQEQLH